MFYSCLQFGRSLSKSSKKSSPSSPISSPDIHPVHRTSRYVHHTIILCTTIYADVIVFDAGRNLCVFLCFCSGASRVAMSESDSSSLNSVELDGLGMAGAVDSDTGLESMSSAETPSGKPCSMCCCDAPNNDSRVEGLRQDVTRLKCDKLELLRQNVVSLFCLSLYLSLLHRPFIHFILDYLIFLFFSSYIFHLPELSTRNKEVAREGTSAAVGTHVRIQGDS